MSTLVDELNEQADIDAGNGYGKLCREAATALAQSQTQIESERANLSNYRLYVEQSQKEVAEMRELLRECRKWEAEGEYGDPLGSDCWSQPYAAFMTRLDAALKQPL